MHAVMIMLDNSVNPVSASCRMVDAFCSAGQPGSLPRYASSSLTRAIKHEASIYIKFGDAYNSKPAQDLETMLTQQRDALTQVSVHRDHNLLLPWWGLLVHGRDWPLHFHADV